MYCLIRMESRNDENIIHYFVAADMYRKELKLCKDKKKAYQFKNLIDCEITCKEINQWIGENKLKVMIY